MFLSPEASPCKTGLTQSCKAIQPQRFPPLLMTYFPFYPNTLEAKVLFRKGRGSDEGGESSIPDDERSSVIE